MKLAGNIAEQIDFQRIIAHGANETPSPSTTLLLPGTYLEQPLTDEKSLKNCLSHYFFSLSVLQDALIQFLDHHYRKFDALIGNNSCYASAYTIFRIALRIESEQEFKTQASSMLKKLEKVKKKALHELKELSSDHDSANDFRQFLFKKDLVLDLPIELIYLGLAYGCGISKTKSARNIEEIDYEALLQHYKKLNVNLSKKSTIKLIKHWQKVLAILNVKTLQDHANFSTAQPWTKYLFSRYVLTDERNRPCLPSFYASKVIYDLLLATPQALIGLQVNLIQDGNYLNRFTLLYEVQPDGTLKAIEPDDSTRPIYMFVGCRYLSEPVNLEALKAEFSERSLEEIIFAHEVTYPQYPKSLKAPNIQPDEPELKKEIKRLKKLHGFSLEDPSDLCLAHIFVDDTQSQALSAYDPPVYLPELSEKQSDDKSCDQTHDRRVVVG